MTPAPSVSGDHGVVCSGLVTRDVPIVVAVVCCGVVVWWCTVGAGATLHSLSTTAGARPGRYILTYTQSGPSSAALNTAHQQQRSSDT